MSKKAIPPREGVCYCVLLREYIAVSNESSFAEETLADSLDWAKRLSWYEDELLKRTSVKPNVLRRMAGLID